jgi:hypothetical protein
MYFLPVFFNINVSFTIHLIKEIKLLGLVFLHQMYAYERFNGILNPFVRIRAYPEGSIIQGYCTEEAVEWALNYADSSNRLVFPNLIIRGGSQEKGSLGRRL